MDIRDRSVTKQAILDYGRRLSDSTLAFRYASAELFVKLAINSGWDEKLFINVDGSSGQTRFRTRIEDNI